MVVEGEAVRAFAEIPTEGATSTRVWAEKDDGTPVLEASASIDDSETLLAKRMAALRPPERLLILEDLHTGMTGAADERVRMDPDQHMGALYPFSLNQKLAAITETSTWYSDASASPWGRAIIPLEMVSVLAEYSQPQGEVPGEGPRRRPVRRPGDPAWSTARCSSARTMSSGGRSFALAESRRTESYWVRSKIFDASGSVLKAEMLLNHATLKESYAGYAKADA